MLIVLVVPVLICIFILLGVSKLMAAIDDLNAAVANLQTQANAIETAYKGADQSPAIESAVSAINAVSSQLAAAVAPPAAPAA